MACMEIRVVWEDVPRVSSINVMAILEVENVKKNSALPDYNIYANNNE